MIKNNQHDHIHINQTHKKSNGSEKQYEEEQRQLEAMFPHKPYRTQLKIAHTLYTTLKDGVNKVVIVESPTGTGKTYALLVGVLAWLHKNPYQLEKIGNKEDQIQQKQQSNSIPPWLKGKTQQNKVNKLKQQKEERLKKLKHLKQAKQCKNKKYGNVKKQDKNTKLQWEVQDIEDMAFQSEINKGKRKVIDNMMVQQLFNTDQFLPKVIFVSRTHSQLSQVMQSIGKLGIPFRYVNMASKDHLCVHSQIQKNRVHEKCQYLLNHGGCPYYHQESIQEFLGLKIQQAKKLGEQNSLCSYFSIKNLLPICDILCLPYSSILSPQIRMRLGINIRNSIIIFDEAHNVIQQELSMKSPQISYKQLQLLCAIIDEYKAKYSSKIAEANLFLMSHIQQICRALMTVMTNEYDIINQINKQNTNQQAQYWDLVYQQEVKQNRQSQSYTKMNKIEFFFKLKLPEIKVNKIKNYISLSNFDQKLIHFNKQQFSPSILNNFLEFVTMLTTSDIYTNKNEGLKQSSIDNTIILIKNLLGTASEIRNNKNNQKQSWSHLNEITIKIFSMESTQLASIADQARLTILAGGTMEPINSFTSIFKNANLAYNFVKGEHVIKDNQCNVYCISGVSLKNKTKNKNENEEKVQPIRYNLTFTYNNLKYDGKKILEGSCRVAKEIVNKTQKKSGTVIFIQNYNFLETFAQFLGQDIDGIPIFYDSNERNSNTKNNVNAFEKYQKQIKQLKTSAILVSVMGGRLSQGINFSDELARSIIVLGLPFPNIKAPEMIQKMKYLDLKLKTKLQTRKQKNQLPTFESARKYKQNQQKPNTELEQNGRSYYQNCCIRTINQTIGRGIRHINDYANIYLIDSRFCGISHKLSSWLEKRVKFIDYYQC